MYLNSNINNVLYVGKYLNSTNLIVFAPIKINFTWYNPITGLINPNVLITNFEEPIQWQ